MSAVALSHGMRQLMCARKRVCLAGRVLPITCFVFNFLSSDSGEDKVRNAQLLYFIWYSYIYIQEPQPAKSIITIKKKCA